MKLYKVTDIELYTTEVGDGDSLDRESVRDFVINRRAL